MDLTVSVAGWNGNTGVVESVSKGFGKGIHGRLADSESTDRDSESAGRYTKFAVT
jgi:hypothetical protein